MSVAAVNEVGEGAPSNGTKVETSAFVDTSSTKRREIEREKKYKECLKVLFSVFC